MAAKFSTACLALAGFACAAPETSLHLEPLVDDRHSADVLTESRLVDPPPSLGGNRFLRGWFPWRHEGAVVYVPNAEGGVLQLVNLSHRPRTLQLESRLLGEAGDYEVSVEVAGQKLAAVSLGASTAVPLPADLPLGRVPIRLQFDKEPDPVVLQASVDQALPPGEVRIESGAIVQAPNSLVDFTRPIRQGGRLVGRFSPPAEAREGQRFAVRLDRDGHAPQILFEWNGSRLDRFRGTRTLSAPLPGDHGLVQIRLIAEGSGAAATWEGLGVAYESPADVAAVTPAPPSSPPRLVVLYVLDALRADALDLSDSADGHTPTLARLAAEGVVFERHLSVAPNTIPSTKSLFTGQAFVTRGHWKLPTDGPETLAEAFAAAGFRTGAFSGNGYISDAYGTSRGFEHLADEVVFREYEGEHAYNDNAERVHASTLAWLDGLEDGETAFAYVHTIHPHNPYDPPTTIQRRYTTGIDSDFEASTRNLLDVKHNRTEVTASDQERISALYRGAVAYNDARLAEFVDELTQRFAEEEILLIITSDHGEELFDHGGVLHGYTLYREQLDIPLILWWPGRLAPERIVAPTTNLDLHESLRALIGAGASEAGQGRPLWTLLNAEGGPPVADDLRFAAASSVKGGIFLAQSDRYKLILAPRIGLTFGMGEGRGRGRDPEYLFDLRNDSEERVNLAGDMSLEPAWMRSRLQAWIDSGKLLEMDAEEPVLDEETQQQLKALGYLE